MKDLLNYSWKNLETNYGSIITHMSDVRILEPFATPTTKLGFLLDWRVTMKCNYDCSYCTAHDNTLPHPDKHLCESMLSQALRYVDRVMEVKKTNMRSVTLNIYGGEAVYHPDIEYLLAKSSDLYDRYKDRWSLIRLLTTNASCNEKRWRNVIQHLEYVQFSYHAEGPGKLKENYLRNLSATHKSGKRYGGVIMMYPKYWQESIYMCRFMQKKGYNIYPKLIDGGLGKYNEEQLSDLKEFWPQLHDELINKMKDVNVMSKGRACCGNRLMCVNRDFKNPVKFVSQPNNSYMGYHCSANQFFLMADSHTQNFYTNKDCHVRMDGTRGPIATRDTMDDYIDDMERKLAMDSNLFLKCVQKTCACGTCAPKATSRDDLIQVMKIYNSQA